MGIKVLIPIIRQVAPILVAQEIIGVQSMTDYLFSPAMRIGEIYVTDAAGYNEPGDEVDYYWAIPSRKSHPASVSGIDRLTEIYTWCQNTFGNEHTSRWYTSMTSQKYHFKNPADRTAFILRWG